MCTFVEDGGALGILRARSVEGSLTHPARGRRIGGSSSERMLELLCADVRSCGRSGRRSSACMTSSTEKSAYWDRPEAVGRRDGYPYEARQYCLYLPDGPIWMSPGGVHDGAAAIFLGFPDGHKRHPRGAADFRCLIDSVSGWAGSTRHGTTFRDLSGDVRKRTGIRFTKGEHPLIEVEFNGGARGAERQLFPSCL